MTRRSLPTSEWTPRALISLTPSSGENAVLGSGGNGRDLCDDIRAGRPSDELFDVLEPADHGAVARLLDEFGRRRDLRAHGARRERHGSKVGRGYLVDAPAVRR